jgi:DNA invertase Pin-like site-specific DNA recombinase
VSAISQQPVITVIPATTQHDWRGGPTKAAKRRVAAYARVSTDDAEQLTSYEAQVDFYTKHIKANPDWEFVEVYADEGITGTSTLRRKQFNRMVEDALSGKIDLILTKSISRFARNTVDTLTTVRKLKEKDVEIYFEKENIYTLDSKGELLITIMSSLAQEESRSISENVTWGQRKRMQDGKVTMAYKHFLGYRKGADGKPEIVEEEAKTIRLIYAQFLEGRTFREIAAYLTEQGILSPAGKSVWNWGTLRSILQNEKYAGNAVLQKHFTVDFLTKKQKVNEGEVPQYYVENSHPAIISPSTFERVQEEIQRRHTYGKQLSGNGLFFGKILCAECGGFYGSKTWHSKDKYRRIVWQCNKKYREKTRCSTPHLTEEAIQEVFVTAWNILVYDKARYTAEYEAEIQAIGDFTGIDRQTAELMAECAEISARVQDCIRENAANAQNQEKYQKRYDALVTRYDDAKTKLNTLNKQKSANIAKKEQLKHFLGVLSREGRILTAFSELLWRETVETLTVYAQGDNTLGDITVRFKSGTEISVKQ